MGLLLINGAGASWGRPGGDSPPLGDLSATVWTTCLFENYRSTRVPARLERSESPLRRRGHHPVDEGGRHIELRLCPAAQPRRWSLRRRAIILTAVALPLHRVLSKNPIDAKTECLFGRGLGSGIGRQAADDHRLW